MADNKRILSIQDISCLGQCSMAVAVPILSVCGLETCMLPTMILSTHTGGLGTPYRRALTEDISPIAAHWQQQGICFDGISVGYLGENQQVQLVVDICQKLLSPEGKLIVDPAMADHGKRYSGISPDYVEEMKMLCRCAEVILPNLTEGYLLAGQAYHENPTRQEVAALLHTLQDQFGGTILLTGVGFSREETGFALGTAEEVRFYQHSRVGGNYHGTGDMFAAVFSAGYLQGMEAYDAGALAADFVAQVAGSTAQEPAHAYGTRFEKALPWLLRQFHSKG